MDWKPFLGTFGAIFVAELGDKTQLATLSFASGGHSRLTVFVAASLALVASAGIAVLAGAAITRVIPPVWLHRGAGVVFLALGVLFLLSKGSPEGPPALP
jgi:Ca2+/H+ antiporter, TMEM165/GDT1 family